MPAAEAIDYKFSSLYSNLGPEFLGAVDPVSCPIQLCVGDQFPEGQLDVACLTGFADLPYLTLMVLTIPPSRTRICLL